MLLVFAHIQTIGPGTEPCVIHTPANVVQVISAGHGGQIYARNADTPYGAFDDRVFSAPFRICQDVLVEHLKLKFVHSSIFAVWKNLAEVGEVVPYVSDVVHTVRHRFSLWAIRQNISKYLTDGSLDFDYDDQVTRMSIGFENPGYILSHEESTRLNPGAQIALFFKAGSSNESFAMGKYYIDKNSMSVADATTTADCRNTIGKFLKDQSFDSENNYAKQNLKLIVDDICTKAHIPNFWSALTDFEIGMLFPPDMTLLDGLKELFQASESWILREDFSGNIGFGNATDPRFGTAGTYEFERDKDIFSRSVDRDDQDVYARVCVHNEDYSIAEYRDLEFIFVLGAKKTLHVSIPKETVLADAQLYANNLVGLMSGMGTIETFNGPFRPYLRPGDNAKIFGQTTRTLGMITSIRHKFGKSGFTTEFAVDSGSMANRTRVSDYINKITGTKTGGQATRLY